MMSNWLWGIPVETGVKQCTAQEETGIVITHHFFDEKKQVDMKPAGQPHEQAGSRE